jgi:hypothetical protein
MKPGKLEVSPAVVQAAVEALSFVLAESARQQCNEQDFIDTLTILAFPAEVTEELKDVSI